MRLLSLVIATTLAAVIVLFYDRNPEVVRIDLLLGRVSAALSLVVLGAAFLGTLVGGVLVSLWKQRVPKQEGDVRRET
ncbi:MAG: LapA family protein [Nitrospirota bacterium]